MAGMGQTMDKSAMINQHQISENAARLLSDVDALLQLCCCGDVIEISHECRVTHAILIATCSVISVPPLESRFKYVQCT